MSEPGRDAVRRLAKRAGAVATSGIAAAEVAAAFHRRLRERSIDVPFEALQGQFDRDAVDLERAGVCSVFAVMIAAYTIADREQ